MADVAGIRAEVETAAPPVAATNLALYRKYRSATFADIIGQGHVTEPLRAALSAKRINHAYLFSGPRGCGKTSSARILARSLNCAQGPTPDPCGECASCVELAPNGPGSIDVIEIDAASHGGVDDARDLRERAFFAPVRDRFKVYIIDEAHMVTTQGFNALLKLVEEPPDFLVFVFATTEPDKVLTTIRSRTHHYPFRLIPPAVMRANLEHICDAEDIKIEPAVLPLVVRAGGGSARDSQSILDQLLAGAGPDGVTYTRAIALLGVTDGALLDDMVDALAAGDAKAVYGTVDRVAEAGHDPRRFTIDLLDRFRDLILLEAVPDAAERGLIDGPDDGLTKMADQVLRLGAGTLTRWAEIVHTALIEMRGTTSPRLVLELLCARMMLPDSTNDAAALLQRIERVERRVTAGGGALDAVPAPISPAPAPVSAIPVAESPAEPKATVTPETTERPATTVDMSPPEPVAPSVAEAVQHSAAEPASPGALDAAALRRLWPEVLEVVKGASRRTRALLDNAQIVNVQGELVSLTAPGALAKMIGEDSNTAVLRTALTSVVGGDWRIEVEGGVGTVSSDSGAQFAPPAEQGRVPLSSASTTPAAASEDLGPPLEPDPRDDGDYEPESGGRPRHDPETEALELLRTQLDARPLDS